MAPLPFRLSSAWASPEAPQQQWSSGPVPQSRARLPPLAAAPPLPEGAEAVAARMLPCQTRLARMTSSWRRPFSRAWWAAAAQTEVLRARQAAGQVPAVLQCRNQRPPLWRFLGRWWKATTGTSWLPRWRAAWAACSAWCSRRCGGGLGLESMRGRALCVAVLRAWKEAQPCPASCPLAPVQVAR